MSLYKGYAQQRGFKPVNIPDPAEKIRAQGLRQLQYMQEELDAKNKQAQELQEVFNQNINLEQKLRADKFEDKKAYGQQLAKWKWKNYETLVQNERTKAEQKSKDWEALLSLTKSGAQILKQHQDKSRADIDSFAAEIYRDYGINPEKFNAIKDFQKGIRLNDQGLNSLIQDLELKGVPLDVIAKIRRGGGYMNIAVGKLAAKRRAIGLNQYFAQESNTKLDFPGYKGLTLSSARGANVEIALQVFTAIYFKNEEGEQIFSSKIMALSGANELIDQAKISWRRRDTEKTAKEELNDQHKSTITIIKDFIGYDADLGKARGPEGIPLAVVHYAGGADASARKFRYAKRRVHAALLDGLKNGSIRWSDVEGLETLPVRHKSSKEKVAWAKVNPDLWKELEVAGLAQEDHLDNAVKLRDSKGREEGREFYQNMIELNKEYKGDIPDSVMQSMIGYGTQRGHHFAAGVQYLQKVQATGLTAINDKVGTASLLAKSERGEIITDEDITGWNLSKSVERQVRAKVNKYNTWLPQAGDDGTKERLKFRIETKLNDIIDKKTSWHESVTWNDTRIYAEQQAARYYRTYRELGKSHEESYEYARDMIEKDIDNKDYYKKTSVDGRLEFKGALAKNRDVVEIKRDEILEELTANPDIIHSKKYIDAADLKVLSGKANKGQFPEMHGTAMLIQSITDGKISAVDVINAGLAQIIAEEEANGGTSTTQMLPEAYVKKYKEVNEYISPFAMKLLESYELCDINKACLAAKEDGSRSNLAYTKPIVEKVAPVVKRFEDGNSDEKDHLLIQSANALVEANQPLFNSRWGLHDPALLTGEAYNYLYQNNRYNSMILPSTRGRI